MMKQKLNEQDSALMMVLLAVIFCVFEIYYLYQYFTKGLIELAPNAVIQGNAALAVITILGIICAALLPFAVRKITKSSE